MALYEVFEAFGFKTYVKPVYQQYYFDDVEEHEGSGNVVGTEFLEQQIGGIFDEGGRNRMHLVQSSSSVIPLVC